jgi:uridine kinase
VLGIAGGSGSGKTTLSQRLVAECAKRGIRGQILSLDNYYLPLDDLPLAERAKRNFDDPEALDFRLAAEHLRALKSGRAADIPVYDFKKHTRRKDKERREPTDLVVVEGIYALYPKELLELYDYRIFVSTGIATAVLRRLQRDVQERGRDIEGARLQILNTVIPMYDRRVKPTQRNAHFSINWEGDEIPDKAVDGLVRMAADHFSADDRG